MPKVDIRHRKIHQIKNNKSRKKKTTDNESEEVGKKKSTNQKSSKIPSFAADFIDTFSINPQSRQSSKRVEKRPLNSSLPGIFNDITLDNYTWPKTSSLMNEQMRRLNKISKNIEKKVIKGAHHFIQEKSYKVAYERDLNESQLTAISTTSGPLLVIAGAGTGKTRTLTYRASYMLENGLDPNKILLLTFTRKASIEMIGRTIELLQNQSARKITGGTFHSFTNYALRRFSGILEINPGFTVIDTGDSEDIISLIRDEKKFKTRSKAFPKKNRIHEILSLSKNLRISHEELIEKQYSGLLEYTEDIGMIGEIYRHYKEANNLYDYDDLIDYMVLRLRDNDRFREKVRQTWTHIMVDEYQDTNLPQKELVDLLSGGELGHKNCEQNIMVVGDDAQSIYSFRGANFENILTFPETYPNCKVVKIEENYRSSPQILDFTNSIIANAKIGYPKKLHRPKFDDVTDIEDIKSKKNKKKTTPSSGSITNANVKFKSFYNQEDEAEYIVNRVIELREQDISLENIAILVRAMYHSNHLQIELLKKGIPYVVVGGIKFSEKKHIRDIIAFLRISQNPYDALAWHRILKLIDGIGDITAKTIILDVRNQSGHLNPDKFKGKKFSALLKDLSHLLKKISNTRNENQHLEVSQRIDAVRDFYSPILREREDDYELRLRDIEVLYNYSAKYDDLEKFLSDFVLDPPSTKFQDHNDPLIDEAEEKPLVISTVHSSKGLEWHTVFIPHLLDGLIPSVRSLETLPELEEERRLFYVAATRSKAQLFLTMPSFFASWDAVMTLPTRFIAEVNEKYWTYDR